MARRKMLGIWALGLAPLGLSTQAQAEWVEWIADAGLSSIRTDNVNLSAFAPDEHSDRITLLHAAGGRHYQFSDRTRLSLSAEADDERYQEFEGLDNRRLGLLVSLRHKFGLGAEAPWLQGYGRYTDVDADHAFRDGRRAEAGARFGLRFGERFDAVAGVNYSEFEADTEAPIHNVFLLRTDVFDVEAWRASLTVNAILSEDLLLSLGYERFDGNTAANCPSRNVRPLVVAEGVRRIIRDPVLGGCTYTLEAEADNWMLNLNYAINGHWAVNASYNELRGEGRSVDYVKSMFSIGILYSH